MSENTQNTVPFEYTLRPIPNQPAYIPTAGEPWNPPPVATYLHLQVQLPFTVNREYGLAVDWPNDAGMRPSANKVISLASDKTYNAGTLELTEDGKLFAHYVPENNETTYSVEWGGAIAESIKAALVKLFNHDYNVAPVQLEDKDEEPDDSDTGNVIETLYGKLNSGIGPYSDLPDKENDEEDEYDLYED